MSLLNDSFKMAMENHPPVECDFNLGDTVIFTNDYGVTFGRTVMGFRPTDGVKDDFLPNRFIYLDRDAWWMPVSPDSLRHHQ